MSPTLLIREPAIARFKDFDPVLLDRARRFLTFQDQGVAYQISKHKKNRRWQSSDPEGWSDHLEGLKSQLKRCILFEDEEGFYTYSGLVDQLRAALLSPIALENSTLAPEPRGMAWAGTPRVPRPYQQEAKEALLAARHGAISCPTGAGKSFVLVQLVHDLGLKTLVIAPSQSILSQLVADFRNAFGDRYVGQFGGGKKKFDRLITVGTFQSLTRLEPGDPAWEELSKVEVLLCDESHLTAAATLEKVCMGLARNAPYRFFVSATQVRGDGSELVLKGVTGPIVYKKEMKELVDQKFLAKPHFHMIRVRSDGTFESDDALKMGRKHFYYNPRIVKRAAEIANSAVKVLGHQVLIMVEEISQFAHLLRHLEFNPRFAHGAAKSDPELRSKLPEQYWASDPLKLVDEFNDEGFPILVATSCCGMGTDFRTPQTVINLQGGRSPIGTPQLVGRGTRRHTFHDGRKKTSFNLIDFCPILNTRSFNDGAGEDSNHSPPYRHALARAAMYEELYPNVRWENETR